MWSYVKALLKHWVALVSGIGSVIVGMTMASLEKARPYWTFWIVALACFFVASFRAWRDVRAELKIVQTELDGLRAPKYSAERLQLAQKQYAKLGNGDKALLRELRLRGQMMDGQASQFVESHGFGRMYGLLSALQNNTNFVHHDVGDQFRINPEMAAALDKILEDETGRTH